MLTEPRPYQLKAAKMMRRHDGRVLLADDMGLGKSLEALLFVEQVQAFPFIVICPAGLKYNWRNEIRKHLGIRADILDGMKPDRWTSLRRHKAVIINYDILKPWNRYLRRFKKACKVKTIIVDECKNIKSSLTLRNEQVRKVCRRVPYVIMADGTPLENRPSELWPALNILWPDTFPSFFDFGTTYCEAKLVRGKWEYKGAKNLPQLHQLLKECGMIRRTKKQVLKDLPDKTRVIVPLQISSPKEYHQATNDFLTWVAKLGRGKVLRAMRADAFTKTGYLKRLAAELKLPAIIEWIDNFLETGEKLIVFGHHKKILRPLRERYRDICCFIDGSTSGHQRQLEVEAFNHKKSKRLLIGQTQAASQGWSATDCSVTCHVEMEWKPAPHMQGEDRVYGLGRGREGKGCFAYYLVAHGTIEERLCELLQKKQANITAILDGKNVEQDFNIFDQLVEELTNERRRKQMLDSGV
jgi:SWI/SNF-related matrix-associated actin-dependent regulator 1 of chromatin subfamily A